MVPSNSSYLSNAGIFHFHEYGRKGKTYRLFHLFLSWLKILDLFQPPKTEFRDILFHICGTGSLLRLLGTFEFLDVPLGVEPSPKNHSPKAPDLDEFVKTWMISSVRLSGSPQNHPQHGSSPAGSQVGRVFGKKQHFLAINQQLWLVNSISW